MSTRLIAISGLPGIGKTSVAEIAAVRTASVHLSIDVVEEAILASGLPAGWQVGVAAYEATRAMAEQNLRLGLNILIDAVNDSEEARETWRAAGEPTWADVQRRRRTYAPWVDDVIELDTAGRSADTVAEALVARIGMTRQGC